MQKKKKKDAHERYKMCRRETHTLHAAEVQTMTSHSRWNNKKLANNKKEKRKQDEPLTSGKIKQCYLFVYKRKKKTSIFIYKQKQ